jgi:hypothetical protein
MNDPDVADARAREQHEQVPDPGVVDLDADIVDVGVVRRRAEQRLAVAEADVQHARAVAAEDRLEVEPPVLEGDAVARQQLGERPALAGGRASGASHEAANLAKVSSGHGWPSGTVRRAAGDTFGKPVVPLRCSPVPALDSTGSAPARSPRGGVFGASRLWRSIGFGSA